MFHLLVKFNNKQHFHWKYSLHRRNSHQPFKLKDNPPKIKGVKKNEQ